MQNQTNVDGASIQSIVTRPILFSGAMVQAILSGRKTQTRRVITPQPEGEFFGPKTYHPSVTDRRGDMRPGPEQFGIFDTCGEWSIRCPYGCPGDRLWVRETWAVVPQVTDNGPKHKAKGDGTGATWRANWDGNPSSGFKWKPSIHMPRWASRITLEIRNVSVERLHDIDEEDAIAEGIATSSNGVYFMDYSHGIANACKPEFSFMTLWKSINGRDSWDANPFVWVVGFKVV